MNRNQIIDHLTKVTYIRNTCNIAEHLADDLFQHIWVLILELDATKLETIYKNGYLQFYIYRMIINESKNPNNKFIKQLGKESKVTGNNGWLVSYEKKREDFRYIGSDLERIQAQEEYDYESDREFEQSLKHVKTELDKMYFYDRKLFELYLEHKSLRNVEEKTGIKYGAVHQTVTKVKKRIIESFNSRTEK